MIAVLVAQIKRIAGFRWLITRKLTLKLLTGLRNIVSMINIVTIILTIHFLIVLLNVVNYLIVFFL